jgi:hypothetical protein
MEPAHSWSVAEVIGQVSGKPLGEFVKGACGDGVTVERVELRHLPPAVAGEEGKGGERRRGEVLGDNGTFYCSFSSSSWVTCCLVG